MESMESKSFKQLQYYLLNEISTFRQAEALKTSVAGKNKFKKILKTNRIYNII